MRRRAHESEVRKGDAKEGRSDPFWSGLSLNIRVLPRRCSATLERSEVGRGTGEYVHREL
jgi:hypothetical protein